MNSNKYIISGVIAVVYLLFKFIEMRFLDRENKPLKELVRETTLVYFSALGGFFVVDQLNPMVAAVVDSTPASPPIFTGSPEF